MSVIQYKRIDLFQGKVPEDILYIFQKLQKNGFEVYLVGGVVRDIILAGGFKNTDLKDSDFDFNTSAKPEDVIRIFKEKGKSRVFTVPTGLSHGTVTIIIEKDKSFSKYEMTTFRIDGIYKDGRHPENVRFSTTLSEDLSRRDFTINALAYDVMEKKIYDLYNGLKDIDNRLIKTVGNPVERFSEDGLRPIRACRLSSQLEFNIDKDTLDAIPIVHNIVSMVSMERVHDELIKLLKSGKPSIGLENLRISGLLNLFIPELLEGYSIDQNEFHKHDIYYHNLYTCDAVSKDKPIVRLAALFHDIGKARAKNFAIYNGNGNVFYNHEIIGERLAEKIMKRLKFSNNDINYVSKLVKLHMFYYTEEWSDGAVRRFLRKINGDYLFLSDLFELRKADRIGSGMKMGDTDILNKFRKRIDSIIQADNALKVTDLKINGFDIMEHFKLKPSKIIGIMLEHLLQLVLDNPDLNKKEELLRLGGEFLKMNESETINSSNINQNDDKKLSLMI